MNTRAARVQGLRHSNAAGPHRNQRDRGAEERAAIADQDTAEEAAQVLAECEFWAAHYYAAADEEN